MADFAPAVAEVLRQEGGYIHDTDDPGGETKFGISKRQYPDLDIRDLTEEAARAIYERDYWRPLRLDDVQDQALATYLLTLGVHAGIGQAARIWQGALRACGLTGVVVDGRVGPQTVDATNVIEAKALLPQLRLATIAYYLKLRDQNRTLDKFLAGWIKRALTA